MTNTMELGKTSVWQKLLAIVIAVAAALALPQLFHLLGLVSGLGSGLGATFLPMHLPVFLAGLLGGPVVGLVAGIASPLASTLLSGMPAALMLPNMIAELAGYGLMAGLLWRKNIPVLGKLFLAQVAGRICKAAVILLSVYAFGSSALSVSLIWSSLVAGLPGLMLQWLLIPLIVFWWKNRKAQHG